MRVRRGLVAVFLIAAGTDAWLGARAHAADDRCLELRGAPDTATYVGDGLRVVVTARNTCGEDVEGASLRFKVTVRSKNGGTAGTQRGRFSGTLKAYGSAETVVFVRCDAERAGDIEVEAAK